MAAMSNHRALINNLKKKVRLLESKEAQAKIKLRAALNKVKKLGKVYRIKLTSQMRILQKKFAATDAAGYAKAAHKLERQLLNGIERKACALATAAALIEKKSVVNLVRSASRKAKQAVTGKRKRVVAKKPVVAKKSRRAVKKKKVVNKGR